MADLKQRPGTRERPRSRSARARLTPPGPETVALFSDREAVVKEARERAKSAKVIRGKHTASSKVFPGRPMGSKANKERFTSMYSTDFDGSFTAPPELRPTSPTRRNNPHPAKVSYSYKRTSVEGVGLDLPSATAAIYGVEASIAWNWRGSLWGRTGTTSWVCYKESW